MRKLKLDVEELRVESFTATPAEGVAGTVHGNFYREEPIFLDTNLDCGGGGVNTVGTCIGPTYCCPATWKQTCADTCLNTQCGNSCVTWWCNTCALDSCMNSCNPGMSCTDLCGCPP